MSFFLSMEQVKMVAVVSFYMAAAILMVTVNKWVLLSSALPVFFVVCQLAIAVVLFLVCHHTRILSLPRWDPKVVRALWLTVLVNMLGFTFNTLCIQHVDVSFYQVARGLILPMTVALAFATNSAPPSFNCVLCCGVITLGFFAGVMWDSSVSNPKTSLHGASGLIFGILSSFTTAANSIVISKNMMTKLNGSAIHMAWYSNLLTAMAMLPLIIFTGEVGPIMEMVADPEQLRVFMWGVSLTGFVGFVISIAGPLAVKATSPVTHILSSALRGVLQATISVYMFGDIMSNARLISVSVIILGSCAYVWVKHIEQSAAKAALASGSAVTIEKEKEAILQEKNSSRPLTG